MRFDCGLHNQFYIGDGKRSKKNIYGKSRSYRVECAIHKRYLEAIFMNNLEVSLQIWFLSTLSQQISNNFISSTAEVA